MADPFEVRMRFTSQLQHLNASVASAQKAAQYALKYKDMDEDLHSCILEQLERVSKSILPVQNPCFGLALLEDFGERNADAGQNNMNTRANIMYFIEHFLEMAAKDGHRDYVRMMQRDIIRVVDAVAPDDGSGAANVKVVRKVLQGLQQREFLEGAVVAEIELVLRDRETTAADDIVVALPPSGGDAGGDIGGDDGDLNMAPSQTIPRVSASAGGRRGGGGGTASAGSGGGGGSGSGAASSGGQNHHQQHHPQQRLDKRQVEQRIEEDRERHKRLRESIWAVPAGSNAERDRIWDETSDLGEDDQLMVYEEGEEKDRCWTQGCPHASGGRSAGAVANGSTDLSSNGRSH